MITEPAMDGSDVPHAADLAATFPAPLSSRDWLRNVPGLDLTVASVVAHAAEGPPCYAVDLTAVPGMTAPLSSASGRTPSPSACW